MTNKSIRTAIVFCIITLLTWRTTYAQNIGGRVVEVNIFFHYDKAHIDPTYMDNKHSLQLVDSLLSDSNYISTLHKIEITVQSSPEGSIAYNERLSNKRRASLKEYFTKNYPQIDRSLWSFNAVAENWNSFLIDLTQDENLPNREEVLSIARSQRDDDSKEWLMKQLDNGKPWLYIKEHILPSHRLGASMLFIPSINPPLAGSIDFTTDTQLPLTALPHYTQPSKEKQKLLFALKTNLVLDALSVVNIAAELPIGERWSVVAEVTHPWWRSWKSDFTMQIESYHSEVKYWLGDRSLREQLEGWSVGAYGGWGRYDIQPFNPKGVQGQFSDIGVVIGYAHPIAKNLNLEYSLGVGYLSTKYENYKMAYDTDEYGDIKVTPFPWMQNSLKSILPTRCGVSLVWTIKNSRR